MKIRDPHGIKRVLMRFSRIKKTLMKKKRFSQIRNI